MYSLHIHTSPEIFIDSTLGGVKSLGGINQEGHLVLFVCVVGFMTNLMTGKISKRDVTRLIVTEDLLNTSTDDAHAVVS